MGALPFVVPLMPVPEGASGELGIVGCIGDDGLPLGRSGSTSTSMGIGAETGSLMLDKADSLRS